MSKTKWNQLNRNITHCDLCDRLRTHCLKIAAEKRKAFLDWDYWGKPVPNFGDSQAELLITETLAFHDRRTDDRSDEVWDQSDPLDQQPPPNPPDQVDGAGTVQDPDPEKIDADFDQKLKPQGSLFLAYLALYAVGDLAVRFVRAGEPFLFGMQQAQLIGVGILVMTVPWLAIRMWRGRVEVPLAESSEEVNQPAQSQGD